MEGTLLNGMCRCCASEGTFKDLSSKYHWMGEDEIYSEMLRECFDITLVTTDDGQDGGICEVCITQLRNAANFKKQVQLTEEQFKKRLDNDMYKSNIVKVEINTLEDDGNASDNNLSDDFSEYEVPIKMEEEDTKGKKRGKGPATRSKKPKLEAESSKSKRWDTSSVEFSELFKALQAEPPKVAAGAWSVNIKKGESQCSIDGNKLAQFFKTPTLTVRSVTKINKAYSRNIAAGSRLNQQKCERPSEKHLHNIQQILLCTNATPIKTYDTMVYTCYYCNHGYPTAQELKKHNLDEHDGAAEEQFKIRDVHNLLIKLDITDFECTLCDNALDNLEDAIRHLKDVHERSYFNDIANHILSFKFNSDGITCSVCEELFYSFKLAVEHMRVHYSNYFCSICGMPFINRRTLHCHTIRHKQGEFPCTFCDKVLDTEEKRNDHENNVHKGKGKRSKCPHCGEMFMTYKSRINHMVEVHGREPLKLKCMSCDRVFRHRGQLTRHVKRYHLMDKSHECQICDKKFYAAMGLKYHMLTHTGVRQFKCDICSKSYGRKYTLREHMRIHADDRRFKCDFCDLTFVQKCSLKGHLRSKHSKILDLNDESTG